MGLRAVITVALILAIGTAPGCRPGAPSRSIDLLEGLGRAAFIEYEEPLELGRSPAWGALPESLIWVALPLTASSGWLAPTRRGWHPIGSRAVLEHQVWWPRSVDRPVLRLDILRNARLEGSQRLRVDIDGSTVGEAVLELGLNELAFAAPAFAFERPTTIELAFDPAVTRDGFRPPPLMLVGFGLVDGEASPSVPSSEPAVAFAVEDEAGERGALRLRRSGKLVAPLDLVPGSSTLELELRCPGGDAAVHLSIFDRLGRRRVDEDLGACDSRWQSRSMSFEALSDPVQTLAIEVLGESTADLLEIRRARIVVGAAAPDPALKPSPVDGPATSAKENSRPPDILLIVLDAARAGNFGFAGYARDTTPKLDRLAEESLVFDRAYAECPNTSCSIPNLISGVPFMNLGTVFHGKRIPDEVTTLAEYLKPLGYRTVGLSANPNNAVSRNGHQGFDYFERLAGAHRQAELAAETIAAQPADQPLYLQLHFLPPHQPYTPTEEFDLFTDPSYQGPVHPRVGLRSYSAGLASFSDADVEQLMALYDGNLRMADDAVGEVLSAMEKAGRWDNALVLLTSDHGEAFGEHDSFQHNSTVFDEMLHVPFLLHLPGGMVPAGVDTSRLVALADAVPTILAYLGLEPEPEVWGIDLLKAGPIATEPRFLYHRTFHRERPLLAIRDDHWKAVTGIGLRGPLLYDLTADPTEEVDLSSLRPEIFSGLALRLQDFLVDWEQRVPQSTQDVELSAEETKLLRSLGYVE